MFLKSVLILSVALVISCRVNAQTLKNTSYINKSLEKVLRFEMELPVDVVTAWRLFTTDQKLVKWIAPIAHIELRSGGYIITNYDSLKTIADSSSIRLPIINFLDQQLLTLRVILNDYFDSSVRTSNYELQEIIQFVQTGKNKTRITSSMIGWKTGPGWEKVYNFFAKGNEWTYRQLIRNYNR